MGFGIERFAGGALDEIAGEVAPAIAVDFLAEPSEKRLVVPVVEGVLEAWQIPLGGLPEVGAGEITQSVGGEVAEATERPVDVLQTAFGVIGHLQAEEFLEELVPGGGEIADLEIPGDKMGFGR